MVVKNLLQPEVKQEIIHRINALTPQSQRQWGKMEVAQMLAHVQVPVGVALGTSNIKGNFLFRLILPLFKKKLYDESEWKQGLPTDKTFVMVGTVRDFEKEKMKLLEMINQFTETNLVNEKHPIFGKLTKEQWAKTTWKHLDHHLRQFNV